MKILGRQLDFDIEPFKQRLPWVGTDLQTVRSVIFREIPLPADERLIVTVDEKANEALSIAVNKPTGEWNKKVVILCHGLGGTEGSGYMIRTARHFLNKGWMVVRNNCRGVGPSAQTSTPPYHAGLTSDLLCIMRDVESAYPTASIHLMGFSLGGHLVLKTLSENQVPDCVKGGVSVSAPLHLSSASVALAKWRNKVYVKYLVDQLKRDLRKFPTLIDPVKLDDMTRIRELDNEFVAPKFGFDGNEDYYQKVSVQNSIVNISLPTLAIHAADDPWIPVKDYEDVKIDDHASLTMMLVRSGGHLGFFGKGSKINWFIPVAEKYFNSLT